MAEPDCGFDDGARWFRLRAVAVILHEGSVLMMSNQTDPYLYTVGGGVQHGETAEEAVIREVREELGLECGIDRLLFIHQNFFTDPHSPLLVGRACHEVSFHFLMTFDPEQPIRPGGVTTDGRREQPVWVPLTDYGRTRPAHPAFYATELLDPPTTARLITTRQATSQPETQG
ncbi:MAG: NUDIX domain-containing protein [Propionibacteriaceae bacterium]|nr:NUDIX domain-containing protein [Propionibacteriaceae bacterium]